METYFSILYVGAIVLTIASMWKVFEKAGQEGWACLIPIYNVIVLLRIVEKPVWWLFLFFIPLINVFVVFYIQYLVAQSFEKDILYAIGLFFLPFIFYPILGFGDAVYVGPNGDYFPEEDEEQFAEETSDI